MIVNFSVKNFKSIKDRITLSFEATNSKDLEEYYIIEPIEGLRLLKIGLIYGANGSGKTNLLQALDFLRDLVLDPSDKRTEQLEYTPFLFDEHSSSGNSFFELEFVQNKIKYLYELEYNKEAIINERLYFYHPNKALVYERTTSKSEQLSKIKFGSKTKASKEHKAILEANTLWNNTVLGGYLKTNFASQELQEVTDWFKSKLKPIVNSRSDLLGYISQKLAANDIDKAFIIETLKKADFKISDIIFREREANIASKSLSSASSQLTQLLISQELFKKFREKRMLEMEGKEILFQHIVELEQGNSGFYTLPYDLESHGTQRYYQFSGLLNLMVRQEVIFPIDELEASLHPDLIKHFILSFLVNTNKSQIITTTHYREFLGEKDLFRNDAIWFSEKQMDGSTSLFSLADFDSSVIRNTSSIYNAYKIGKLGAVPNLLDHYIGVENG